MDKQKKYKLALWILAVLPLLLYCCEFTSRKEYLKIFFEYLGYGIIILFTFAFIFYRVKFKKMESWMQPILWMQSVMHFSYL